MTTEALKDRRSSGRGLQGSYTHCGSTTCTHSMRVKLQSLARLFVSARGVGFDVGFVFFPRAVRQHLARSVI